MLTTQEIQAIELEAHKVPVRKAACIEALKIVQQHRRWVSDESITDIAALLHMSAEEVDSVATFYNLIFRKPVGRHVILLCDSISCWVMGYTGIKEKLFEQLGIQYGETTPDERFTLLPNACLGTCDHAPAMMIDEDTYCEIQPQQIPDLLQRYT